MDYQIELEDWECDQLFKSLRSKIFCKNMIENKEDTCNFFIFEFDSY